MTYGKKNYRQYMHYYESMSNKHDMRQARLTFEQWQYQAELRDRLTEGRYSSEDINRQLVTEARAIGSDRAELIQWQAIKEKVKELKMRDFGSLSADEQKLVRMRQSKDLEYYRQNSSLFLEQFKKVFNSKQEYDEYIIDYSPKF